jgi:Subtilase family
VAEKNEYPLLALPVGEVTARPPDPPRGGGAPNPRKARQIERLGPQFLELQNVLASRGALLADSVAATAPEHVLVFVTNGARKEFVETLASLPELEWMFQRDEKVAQDEDFRHSDEAERHKELTATFYMVMFNQRAVEQLLGFWMMYQTGKRMPNGLGGWGKVFSCLREIRRWGPEDCLRDAEMLLDWLEPIQPDLIVPVEIELWPRSATRRGAAEANIKKLVEQAGGAVVDVSSIPEIQYHAVLAELPQREVKRILDHRDVDLIKSSDMFLLRAVPQCALSIDAVANEQVDIPDARSSSPDRSAVCALLDGLPMENHPRLVGRISVEDPEECARIYPVASRRHGTAMASLIIHGDLHDRGAPIPTLLHVHPILRPAGPDRQEENAPRHRLWVDLIHQAVRRMLVGHGGNSPTAPDVRIINLSVGDRGRPFLGEVSPFARLLDWLAWQHGVLFIVSAGNHPTSLPSSACASDEAVFRQLFRETRQRRLLSPAESLNALTVGSLNSDGDGPPPQGGRFRVIPGRGDLPAAYSAQGRGFRRSVKPDVLMAGGRQLFEQPIPTSAGAWRGLTAQLQLGQLVAAPGGPGRPLVTKMIGTSNAAALASRSAVFLHEAISDLESTSDGESLSSVPIALLVKAMMIHTADWHPDVQALGAGALASEVDRERLKDHLSGMLGYGSLRTERGLGCPPSRATALGGGSLWPMQRGLHRFPIPTCLQARTDWRRLTVTLAWFTPINVSDRRYRAARLRLESPRGEPPLNVQGGQVHGDATVRGTVQHLVLEAKASAMVVHDGDTVDLAVRCESDAGELNVAVPYALAVSLEVAPGIQLPIYEQIANRLKVRPAVRPRI